jgi:predicted ester cyclase
VDEVFANGDWVAARLTWSGTNTAELFGQPPTNRFVQATEIEIVRVEDGRIVDLRQVADLGSLMTQLAG